MDQMMHQIAAPQIEEEAPEMELQPDLETGEVPEGEYVPLPEMGGIAWTDVYLHFQDRNHNPAVGRINVTQRHPVSAVAALEMLLTDLKAFMLTDLGKVVRFDNVPAIPSRQVEQPAGQPASQKPAEFGSSATPGAAKPAGFGAGQLASQPANQPAAAGDGKPTSGRRVLSSIKILPPDPGKQPVIEYMCEGLKFPMKEHRGGAIAAGYFDPELGISDVILSTPAVYTQADFGQVLYLYWEKPDKYTNVVKISNK